MDHFSRFLADERVRHLRAEANRVRWARRVPRRRSRPARSHRPDR